MAKARVALVEEQMMVPVAIDDGHSMGKLAMIGPNGQIVERSYRSRTTVGISEMDTDGIVAAAAYFHDIDDPEQASPGITPVLTVQDTTGHEQAVDNRTGDYPKSARNRVLVHHGLHAIGHVRGPVMLGTTLPYGDYYGPAGSKNMPLIEAKKANLAKPVFPLDPASMKAVVPAYEIASQAVFSEGLAAFFDVMLEWDGESVGVCDEFSQRFSADMPTFAVVDIGGKTTDIVYGTWSGQPEDRPKLNVAMSESLTAGILHAADHLADGLKRRFGIKTVRDAEQNLGLRSFKVYGEKHDISDLCRQATTDLFAKIRNGVLRHADDGSGLACVIFVGGGAEVLKDDMAGLFPPSMVMVPPKPSFANARGMLKLMLTAA